MDCSIQKSLDKKVAKGIPSKSLGRKAELNKGSKQQAKPFEVYELSSTDNKSNLKKD